MYQESTEDFPPFPLEWTHFNVTLLPFTAERERDHCSEYKCQTTGSSFTTPGGNAITMGRAALSRSSEINTTDRHLAKGRGNIATTSQICHCVEQKYTETVISRRL